jgi:hypothetical protein
MKKYQTGFALIIGVIIFSLAIIGTLGYFYFTKTIINSNSSNSKNTNSSTIGKVDKNNNLIYTDDKISFEYPKTGWTVSTETKNNPSSDGYNYTWDSIFIRTDDYKPSDKGNPGSSEGLLNGTEITISIGGPYPSGNYSTTLTAQMDNCDYCLNLKKITVDDEKAYSFNTATASGNNLNTVFAKNAYSYSITINSKDSMFDKYKPSYELIINTLKVK